MSTDSGGQDIRPVTYSMQALEDQFKRVLDKLAGMAQEKRMLEMVAAEAAERLAELQVVTNG